MTERHFLPNREDTSTTDLVLCGSSDSGVTPRLQRMLPGTVHAGIGLFGWLCRCGVQVGCLKPRRRRQMKEGRLS
jgi:hypothetical protein